MTFSGKQFYSESTLYLLLVDKTKAVLMAKECIFVSSRSLSLHQLPPTATRETLQNFIQ